MNSTSVRASDRDEKPKFRLEEQSFSTGETPLTKGLTSTSVFGKGKSTFVVDLNAELGEVMYFYSFTKWFSVGPSIGFFKNSPWAGPIAEITLFKSKAEDKFYFKTLNWFGWNAGNAEESTIKAEANFMFSYHQFTFVFWNRVEAYYIFQHYQKMLPEHISGVKSTISLSEKFSVFGGCGYMFRAEKFLWSMGLTFKNR